MNKLEEGISRRLKQGPSTTDDAADAEVEVEWDDDGEIIVAVTCPRCQHVNRISARDAAPGAEVQCQCGDFAIQLSGDDLRDLQRSIDSLGRTLDNLFK